MIAPENYNLPRGIRNNNPGNLVITSIDWQGKIDPAETQDTRFEVFESMYYGVRALYKDLYKDYHTDGQTTIQSLINEFAPSFENNTSNYINIIADRTGLPATVPFAWNYENVSKLIKAIIFVENGPVYNQYLPDSEIEEYISQLMPGSTRKIKETSPPLLALAIAFMIPGWIKDNK